MSALRIRFETMQLAKRYHDGNLSGEQTIDLLVLTEDAFDQWARKYPKDPWLPSTGFKMAQLYEELPGTQSRDHAVTLLVYVKSHFPSSSYARESRDALHRGISAKPQAAPSPQPSSSALPAPALSPAPATPAPSASPTRVY